MSDKLRALFHHSGVQLILLIVLLLCFNNWLLANFLNPSLLEHNGSVSELSVNGQPHAVIFRILDIIAGALFVLFAFLLYFDPLPASGKKAVTIVIATLGIGEIIDATVPLRCVESLDKSCAVPVSISLHHLILPSHAYSSVMISASYFLLPLLGIVLSRNRSHGRLFLTISWIAIVAAIFSFFQVMINSIAEHAYQSKGTGTLQTGHMLLLSFWFLAAYWFWKSHPRLKK